MMRYELCIIIIIINGKRPDGVTQIPWRLGRCLAWDATCPDTFAMCHVTACSDEAGSASANAEVRKCHKYEDIIRGVDFVRWPSKRLVRGANKPLV